MKRILVLSSFGDIFCVQGDQYFEYTISNCIGSQNLENISISRRYRERHLLLKRRAFSLLIDLLKTFRKQANIVQVLYRPHPYENSRETVPILKSFFPSLLVDGLTESFNVTCKNFNPHVIITSFTTCLYQLLQADCKSILVELSVSTACEVDKSLLAMYSVYSDVPFYDTSYAGDLLALKLSSILDRRRCNQASLYELLPNDSIGYVMKQLFMDQFTRPTASSLLQLCYCLRLNLAMLMSPFLVFVQLIYVSLSLRRAVPSFKVISNLNLQLSKASFVCRSRLIFW